MLGTELENVMKTARGYDAVFLAKSGDDFIYEVRGAKIPAIYKVDSSGNNLDSSKRGLYKVSEFAAKSPLANYRPRKIGPNDTCYYVNSKKEPEIFRMTYMGKEKSGGKTIYNLKDSNGVIITRFNLNGFFTKQELINYVGAMQKQLANACVFEEQAQASTEALGTNEIN